MKSWTMLAVLLVAVPLAQVVQAQEGGTIHVTGGVYDPVTGQPLANVPVSFAQGPASSPSYSRNVFSADDGSFEIDLPSEATRGEAGSQQVRSTLFEFEPTEGLHLEIPAYLDGVRATLRIDWDGDASASLRLLEPCTPGCMGPQPGSQDGIYTFGPFPEVTETGVAPGFSQSRSYVAPGRYQLEADGDGASPARAVVELAPGSSWEFEARLQPGGQNLVTVAGVVNDEETGQPLDGVVVDVRNEPAGFSEASQTGPDGGFSAHVAPGVIHIAARNYVNTTLSPESPTWYWSYVMGRYQDSVTDLTIPLDRTRSWPVGSTRIQGWVVDADQMMGISGARVHLWNQDTNAWGEVVADADGSFRFDVVPGRYSLHALADGYPWSAYSVDALGGVVWVNATLFHPTSDNAPGWYGRQDGPYSPTVEPELQPIDGSDEAGPGGGEVFSGQATLSGRAGGLGAYADALVTSGEVSSAPEADDRTQAAPPANFVLGLAGIVLTVMLQRRNRNRR